MRRNTNAYFAELAKWFATKQKEMSRAEEDRKNEEELEEFLDFDGVPFADQGKFHLHVHDRVLLDRVVKARDPLRLLLGINGLPLYQHEDNIKAALLRAAAGKVQYNLMMLQASHHAPPTPLLEESFGKSRTEAYYRTPAIMDTGASFGLTPFRDDFISYQEVNIKVKDVSSENIVTGMGTVLYRIKATNGDTCWIPGLAYHLEKTDIRLISPQAYHQSYGGHSVLDGESFKMHLVRPTDDGSDAVSMGHTLGIPIDKGSNLPMIFDVACTREEQSRIGVHFKSSMRFLQQSEGFFFGRWTTVRIEDQGHAAEQEVTYEFSPHKHHTLPCVTTESNSNLSAAQKEVLQWHFRLGCSLKQVQYMMSGHESKDFEGNSLWCPPIIPVKLPTARTCALPKCATCEMARAKIRKTKSRKTKDSKKDEGALSRDLYMPGDLVSMDSVTVSIPGRLFSGYGKESLKDKLCGITIFHDAGSGVIKVYPQVTNNAADTILSKLKFEEFLWTEAGVVVKKYHSDQGVFVSKMFKAACEDQKQAQTFSGVGAKHMNAFAERSVQTLFWMCRSFMLHTALRWSSNEADSATLWPQALLYAEFLFNRTPSIRNGYSPLERLTQRRSDHKDLLRAHVWGCPTYVLDARLQDGKKIPKFDRRARCGQFLGFSPETSTLVGLVRHLASGHISEQYHCVYDERFETVFGLDDEDDDALYDAVDQIWSKLFSASESEGGAKSHRDWYVTPEFVDDELIYDVPPMDVHWLNEKELRDREDRLQDQRRRNEKNQVKYEKQFEPRPPEPPSPIVRFNEDPIVIEPDDDTISIRSDVKLREVPSSPSEGEVNVDIACGASDEQKELDDSDEQKELDNVWSSRLRKTTTTWKDKRVAIGRDNWQSAKKYTPRQMSDLNQMEKRVLREPRFDELFGHYGITLSDERQVPVEVKRYSGKKIRRQKKRARQNEIAEQQLRAMTFKTPTLEELMASPLAKYIHFAANDSGYDGSFTELICNWVHPMFLSAKAGLSKEDNPNWNEAMSGDEAEEYWEAAKAEVATLESMKAWDVVDRPVGRRVLPSLWVFKKKRKPDGSVKKYKGRFTVRGDRQVEGVDFNETWAPVCNWTTVRLMFILQCVLDLKSASADVACAFLHGSLDEGEDVYVDMPRGFQQPGKCLKLRQSLYGLKQAPRCFWSTLSPRWIQLA